MLVVCSNATRRSQDNRGEPPSHSLLLSSTAAEKATVRYGKEWKWTFLGRSYEYIELFSRVLVPEELVRCVFGVCRVIPKVHKYQQQKKKTLGYMDYYEDKGMWGGWLFAKIGSNRNSCIFQNEHGEYFQRALVSSFGKARWYLWGRQVNIMKPRSYKVFANKHFAWKFKLRIIGNNNSRRLFLHHVLSLKRFSFVLFLVL